MTRSAGILLWRRGAAGVEVLLVHPGGPFWRNRREGAWQLPKGGIAPGESPEAAARREFAEELGHPAEGAVVPLGELRQAGGKHVAAFALAGDLDPAAIVSNLFELEWPPRSGRRKSFPEVDEARWFALAEAETAMLASQRPFLAALTETLGG